MEREGRIMYENVTGRIFDIQSYAVHDGPGIRSTVYMKGCPLRCLWCHSPESQRHGIELFYLPIKCIGTELCGACLDACGEGALRVCEPVKKLDGSGMICKVSIDRSKCTGCLRCADACIPKALTRVGRDVTVDEVYARVDRDRIFFRNGGGITLSGGEPMAQFPFTLNLAKKLCEGGLHVCLDTTDYAPTEQYLEIAPYIGLFLYDIKNMDSELHRRLTGVGNERILENARALARAGAALQIRVVVIPKLRDKPDELRRTAEFCASLGKAVKLVQLLPYHSAGKVKYERLGREYRLKKLQAPAEEEMLPLLDVFKEHGLPCQLH